MNKIKLPFADCLNNLALLKRLAIRSYSDFDLAWYKAKQLANRHKQDYYVVSYCNSTTGPVPCAKMSFILLVESFMREISPLFNLGQILSYENDNYLAYRSYKYSMDHADLGINEMVYYYNEMHR